MKYSVIIPTYNHCDDLLKPCVESILKYSHAHDIELIISANGCKDNTSDYLTFLKEKYDYLGMSNNLKIVWNDQPLGYSKATNEGIKIATCDYIILMNNDVVLLEQNKNTWLDLFENQFNINPKCGISCIIKQFSEAANREFGIFFLTMIHRKVFDKIGLLNTMYGVGGGEDIEFSIEAERAGFEVCEALPKRWTEDNHIYTGNFPVYHRGEGTMNDATLVPEWANIFRENELKLAKKYNIEWYHKNTGVADCRDRLRFLESQHQEIYNEILLDNVYSITKQQVENKYVIDIGANIGTFSLLASELGAKAVYAVEPVNYTFNQLCKNINTGNYKNIVAMHNAVSDGTTMSVNIAITSDIGHNTLYNSEAQQYETVPTITLSHLLGKCIKHRVVLKIDCEGAEYDILLNTSKEDMEIVDRVVLEVHSELHPIYKGYEILNDKMKSFGLTMEDVKQIYSWEYNEKGEQVNWKPLPYRIEIWKR